MIRVQTGGAGGNRAFLLGISIITVFYLALICLTPAGLTGTPEYHWPVLRHGSWARVPAALALLLLAAAGGLMLTADLEQVWKATAGRLRVYLVLFLLGLAFQLGPAAVHRFGLLELTLRVYLPDHTSYFTDAKKISSLRPWLQSFPDRLPEFATHTRTHPPGAVLLFYAALRVAEHSPRFSEWYRGLLPPGPKVEAVIAKYELSAPELMAGGLMALLLALAAAGAAPLTFALGRPMIGNRRAALAAVLFASAPAFSHQTPILDHALALFALLSLWLTVSAVTKKKIWRAPLAGAVIGAGLWLGPTLLAAGPLGAVFCLAAIFSRQAPDSTRKERLLLFACLMALTAGAGVLVTLALGAMLGLDYLMVYQAVTESGWRLNNVLSGRVHPWMWIAFDPYEFLAWAGVPLAAGFVLAVIHALKDLRRLGPDHPAAWTLAALVFLITLDLSGKVCYEASRLVWFGFPLLALSAATVVPPPENGKNFLPAGVLLGGQILCTLVFRMLF